MRQNKIKELLKLHGMKQADLVKLTGFSKSVISDTVNQKHKLNKKEEEAYVRIFGLTNINELYIGGT